MIAIRLWCLLALLSVARCDSGAGLADDDEEGADDSDDFSFSGNDISGAGNTLQNTTAGASTTVVETQTTTTTSRTSTKAVVTTKSPLITQLVQQLTTTTVPTEPENDDDDDDDENDSDDPEPEDKEKENPAMKSQPEQTTMASIKQNEDVAPERTTTVSLDLFQYMWRQPGIMAGLIGGAVLGVLFAILLTLFVIYRLRRRNDRTYRKGGSRGSQDETGAFWFDEEDGAAIAYSRASAERYPPHGHVQQPGAYVNPQAGTLKAAGANTLRGSQMLTLPPGMGPQAQPLLYTAPMAPNAQNSYDEYLANMYNQQLYGSYLQQKA